MSVLNLVVTMNILHALGFFVIGLAMAMVPELAPAFAPPYASFGDVAGLWLQFMGGVMFLISSGLHRHMHCRRAAEAGAAAKCRCDGSPPKRARNQLQLQPRIAPLV